MLPIARIILRYVAMFLMAKGYLSPELGDLLEHDPDLLMAIQMGIGALISLGTEVWYFIAARYSRVP